MRKLSLVVFCLLLLLPVGAGVSVADDEQEAPQMSMRIFHVGALTNGLQSWIRERAAHEIDWTMHDEEQPLFGAEAEEPLYPVGMVDELIEIVKGFVEPAFWEETEGANLASMGEGAIVARATKPVLDKVAAFLGDFERRILTSVAVEIQAVRLAPEDVLSTTEAGSIDEATVDGLVEKGGGPSITLTGYAGQQTSAFAGQQRAYVWDYRVDVAEGATFSDPLVGVANLGLAVETKADLGDDLGTIRLSLDAAMAQLEEARQIDTGEGRTIEVPILDVFSCKTDLLLKPDTWRLVQGRAANDESQWFLLVRATLRQHRGVPTPEVVAPIDPRPFADQGVLAPRAIRVRMLNQRTEPVSGSGTWLLPSHYTPPEPPELPDPRPVMPAEALPELILTSMGWSAWDDPRSIEVRNGMLLVRTTPGALRAVEDIVSNLRRQTLWSIETTAEVVEISNALARRLGRAENALISPADRLAIDEAIDSGMAERIDTARVRNMSGVRNTVRSGRNVAYVSDYAGSIAQEASIANPVVHRALSGLELDVDADLATTGDAADLDVRFVRSRIRRPMRTTLTPHGNLDVPDMDLLRVRASVMIPFGRTAIVGAGGDSEKQTIVLLTPRLSRHGD